MSLYPKAQSPKGTSSQVSRYSFTQVPNYPRNHVLKFQSTQVGAQVPNIPSSRSQFSQFPSTQSTHIPNFPSMYSSSQVPKVPTYPRSQVPKFLCTQVPKKVFEKSYIGTYCCRLHQYEIPNALPATSRCEMDVTFAGNSNEVTP